MASLRDIVSHADAFLRTSEFRDYPGAHNGLQIENVSGTVSRIAAAVDSHLGVIEAAAAAEADLLIVHHGMLWTPLAPVTGSAFKKLALAIRRNLAVYSNHLPLDAHPKIGNNVLLARALGLRGGKPAFTSFDRPIGLVFEGTWSIAEITKRVTRTTGATPLVLPHGSDPIRRLGILTGAGGSCLHEAAALGVDALLTGEGSHPTFGITRELGLSVFYAGHYATETFGIRALAQHLSKKFRIPCRFIEMPTGL